MYVFSAYLFIFTLCTRHNGGKWHELTTWLDVLAIHITDISLFLLPSSTFGYMIHEQNSRTNVPVYSVRSNCPFPSLRHIHALNSTLTICEINVCNDFDLSFMFLNRADPNLRSEISAPYFLKWFEFFSARSSMSVLHFQGYFIYFCDFQIQNWQVQI